MQREYYITPKPSKTMRLFWKAAGADRYLLERATYADQIKYMCLGGVVVATGVMAALAGGYAFYTIFQPKGSALDTGTDIMTAIEAILFGLVWGLIIFNIDRFIVTSTGKGDGTEAITWTEFKTAIPRLIMGMIIAITISKPVEIRMFKSEIDARLYEEQLKTQKEYEIRTRKNFEDRIKDLEKENAVIQTRVDDYLSNISVKDSLYNVETATGQGGRIKGEGPVALALKNERDRLKGEMDQFVSNNKVKIEDIEKRRAQMYSELDIALKQNKKVANGLDGLLERIKLVHEIAGPIISLFITLLFMAIELTPIFFKLMLIKTPYDFMDENVKELIKAENGIEVRYNYYQDKEGHERHLVINHMAEKLIHEKVQIIEAQKKLTEEALKKYTEKQTQAIADNPENFITAAADENIK